MPDDLSSVAIEAAERSGLYPDTMLGNRQLQRAYALGFTECASRIPSREDLAAVLRSHNFDELLLGSIEWDGYTAVCACGWSSEEYKMPGEAHEAHSEHAASNLLSLIGEKISG